MRHPPAAHPRANRPTPPTNALNGGAENTERSARKVAADYQVGEWADLTRAPLKAAYSPSVQTRMGPVLFLLRAAPQRRVRRTRPAPG